MATAGETEFINQRARSLMVDWCDWAVLNPGTPLKVTDNPYTRFAVEKKWLSLKGLPQGGQIEVRILSAGWATAARFLKR